MYIPLLASLLLTACLRARVGVQSREDTGIPIAAPTGGVRMLVGEKKTGTSRKNTAIMDEPDCHLSRIPKDQND